MSDDTAKLIAQARELFTEGEFPEIEAVCVALEAAVAERDEAKAARDVHEEAAIEFCAAADKAEAENRQLRGALGRIADGSAEAATIAAARGALAGVAPPEGET